MVAQVCEYTTKWNYLPYKGKSTVHEPHLNRELKRALPSCSPTHHTDLHSQYISDSFGVPLHLVFPL